MVVRGCGWQDSFRCKDGGSVKIVSGSSELVDQFLQCFTRDRFAGVRVHA
jgi:hypothetical protein